MGAASDNAGTDQAQPLSPSSAAAEAVEAVATATATATATISLVEVDEQGRPEVTTLEVDSSQAAAEAAASAAQDGDLVAVEADVAVAAIGAAGAAAPAPVSASAAAVTGDPLRTYQWALDEAAFQNAWPCTEGAGAVVAVVDTGVAANHPDLNGRVLPGWEFLGSATGVASDGTDPNGHGTHVAGIIAANRNDGIGIAGAAPEAQILPLRVLDSTGSGSSSDVARGITWAVDHGADVVNLSLGSIWPSASIATAVDYAMAQGVVVVAAAGNSGGSGSPTMYPAADDDTIAVAATDPGGAHATYSNEGAYVDVSAPGTMILSLAPNGGHVYMSGTSMATPYVAALAALLVSADPGLGVAGVRNRIEATADDRGSPGLDITFGHGFIDPREALGT